MFPQSNSHIISTPMNPVGMGVPFMSKEVNDYLTSIRNNIEGVTNMLDQIAFLHRYNNETDVSSNDTYFMYSF